MDNQGNGFYSAGPGNRYRKLGSVYVSRLPEYRIWKQMRQRCNNPNDSCYPRYGGRGIKVCERWQNFDNFFANMGLRPKNHSIERLDNDGNYEPNNCKWATRLEQNLNKRIQKNNRSGLTGVGYFSRQKKWRARFAGEFLGYFDTKDQAAEAYWMARNGTV